MLLIFILWSPQIKDVAIRPENIVPDNFFSPFRSDTGKITKKFCESTSLHGFSFMYNANTIAEKLIWIFAIVAMMGVITFFVVDNTDAYLKSRIVTNIESSAANLDVSTSAQCMKVRFIHFTVKKTPTIEYRLT